MKPDLEERIKQIIGNDGNVEDYIIGFAGLAGLLPEKFSRHPYGIVIGKKLDPKIMDSVETGPNLEYWQHYRQVNNHLSGLIHRVADELKTLNISTMVMEPTVSDADLDERYYKTLRVEVSHKMVATRAGLGWIGKTALFISKKFGPRLRLVTIFTDFPMESGNAPIDESRCGKCRVCVEKCPARAANGKAWNINLYRDEFFNPFKCREKCRELGRERMGLNTSVCGICVSVCPIGKNHTL